MKPLSYLKRIAERSLIAYIFLLTFSNFVFAQEGTVLLMNADSGTDKQTIFVKWFIEEVVCDEGVNIYRKTKNRNEWIKINEKPYKYIRPISKENYEKDL